MIRSHRIEVATDPVRDWRWVIGGAGKVLIALGMLMFGFVGYQLWGTGIETELAQRELEDDFERLLAENSDSEVRVNTDERNEDSALVPSDAAVLADSPAVVDGADAQVGARNDPGTAPAVPISEQRLPDLSPGSALSRLEVPAIGIDDIVVAGIGVSDLKKGPGHFPDTPLPGQLGNAAIAGHRTTYGAPFFDIDQLSAGDEIIVTTLDGRYVYEVSGQQIVAPSDYEVVTTSDPLRSSLTLVSCDPKWTAQNRIVVRAELDPQRSGRIGEAMLDYGRPPDEARSAGAEPAAEVEQIGGSADATSRQQDAPPINEAIESSTEPAATETAPGERPPSSDESSDLAEAFEQGWFSDSAANPHVGAWGVALGLIAVAALWVTRRTGRDLVGAAAGFVPFVVALFFFYQNVNRLLPPGL